MRYLRNYKLFKEAKTENYSNKNIIHEICVSMVLLNNTFLDNILDRGLKARYSENSEVFLTDLKNLLLSKNRLHLGKFVDNKCVVDDEVSKVNGLFDSVDFSIEEDWDKLVNARITARNIIDKIIPDEKLDSERIKAIYWIGPNKTDDFKEDIVLETLDGKQYSFYLNKNISNHKSASFNLFADDLIGTDIDKLYKEEYLPKWDKLTQEWIRILYENSNKNIQQHIEKFIDTKRIDSIGYFEYYDIRHKDPRFKHLGEFIQEFNKNILKFSDLMSEIWKMKDNCFMDAERVKKEWMETKIVILNSKILENLLTNSLKTNHPDDIQKLDDEWKLSGGTVKMKLFKTLVEKMGCLERPVYFLGNNGNIFNMVPSREFFRKNYDDLNIKFDYHVNFNVNEEDEEMNDFNIKLKLDMNDSTLIDMNILVKFSSGEMSGKLSAKYKFDLADNFNYLISKKEMGSEE
jgi:hypothetical protein